MQPKILAIDTSTDACSVAVSGPNQIFEESKIEPQAHAKIILGMIDSLCINAKISKDELDAVAFGSGPGSFTGLRIGASVAQGLAFGLQKPVILVSSLQALAQAAANKYYSGDIIPVIDARMQEVYWGAYNVGPEGLVDNIIEDAVTKPAELILQNVNKAVMVGNGLQVYLDILKENNPNIEFDNSLLYPNAKEIVQLALVKYDNGDVVAPEFALPTYIRNNVVQSK